MPGRRYVAVLRAAAATRRLLDLASLGWPPHTVDRGRPDPRGDLHDRRSSTGWRCRPAWIAAPLVGQCCRALLGSFKIWNIATVGGNLCLALPAGPMIALAAALEATCTIWSPGGRRAAPRRRPTSSSARGDTRCNRARSCADVDIPAAALRRRTAFRRISLSPNGRSGALLIGTRDADGAFALTVTASTRRPVAPHLRGAARARGPGAGASTTRSRTALWYDDVHGRPDWRRHVTRHLAEEIRAELGDAPADEIHAALGAAPAEGAGP